MTRLSAPGTRVLLIGTGTHSEDSGLPPVPAVTGTLADLGQVLVERCGLAEDNLRVIRDPANPTELGVAIAQEAERAEGVLLVYYVGHGLVNPAGELYLATVATDSRPGWVAYTALAYTALRGSLLQTPARSIVVMLDCCFSGRAVGVLGSADDQEVDLARVHGGYVLAAAARDELALATPGAPHTAFTGELIRLLTEGDPEGPPQLTLRQTYRYLDRTLPARGFPRPRHRASEWIDDLVLCPNPAFRPQPQAPAPQAPLPVPDDGTPQTCPYPGLAAFGPGQTQWFFGRDRMIAELAEKLTGRMDATDPLVLVGPSGAGKSSLLGAGLLPALGKGELPMPGSRTWPHLLITPTRHPLTELARRLARLTGGSWRALREELERDPVHLAAAVREMLRARAGRTTVTGSRLVLVVDQFEETFTQCADEEERRAFIRALRAAADGGGAGTEGFGGDGEPPALVILSLRSDFRDHCAAFPELRPSLYNTPVFIGPMDARELRKAVEQPAELTGLALQPGLVEVLLRDLGADRPEQGHDPEALPLLAHALRATWQHREDRTLTVAGYVAAGGVRSAIDSTAESVYSEFDLVEQRMARSLMLHLVHVGEGTQDTRRRVSRTRLLQTLPDPDVSARVLEDLVRARMVAVEREAVEIAHEALLHSWPRLRQWIDDDRAGLKIHQQLAEDASAWDRNGRSPSQLYRGSRLSLAREWAGDPDRGTHPTSTQSEFLEVGVQAVRRRRKQLVLPAAAVCLMMLAGITWFALDLRERETSYYAEGRGTLKIGVSTDQPGTSFSYRDGSFQGFDVTVIKDALKGVGVDQPTFQGILPRDRVSVLQEGDVEMVASTFSITANRMKPQSKAGGEGGLDFVGPYASTHQGMLVRKGNIGKYEDLKDFNGKSVCVWEGTTSEDLLAKPAYKDIRLVTVANADECIKGMKESIFDAVSADRLILYGFAQEYPDLAVVEDLRIGPSKKYGIAMKKGHREDCNKLKKVLLDYVNGKRWDRAFDENLLLSSEVREESRPTTSEIKQQSCVDEPGGP
ncbi:transporter substrate-binding domain-containing protein (plasmid) [Streptomyces sp. NBC_00257]|uniref:caspase, EACC1-associated type n=1 Tax=unclassified Streptomyces TaxID=2593676 RepID=UPI0022583CDF|nr:MULTISPECIES: transporter substrate-binding domain-containing protein [unclassified Streptomyces]MCX5434752.1 transporter substrate-binding domain-containing protein [Streptomyces sp. NBC_00062]